MAKTTRRPNDHKTRREGKETKGWEKLGVYLSPDASLRLMLHSMKRGKDRSTILDAMVLSQLPAYTIAVGADKTSRATSVAVDDRLEPADSINLGGASVA